MITTIALEAPAFYPPTDYEDTIGNPINMWLLYLKNATVLQWTQKLFTATVL